jgi:uncharacterized radical SAM superfamily Fe-S cluster-containing enzyme
LFRMANPGPYSVYESTTGICNVCEQKIPAEILLNHQSVYLRKTCPEHGSQTELLEEDASYHLSKRNFDKPGTEFIPQKESLKGCPYDCGLCTAHEQHTCIGLLEITNRCNLNCPICYADSGKDEILSLETIDRILDFYVEAEHGEAEILQISGGEPTLHPDITEIIKLAMSKNIRYVMVNTNGLRIASDPEFVKQLGRFSSRFEIYLQFDGFRPSTYRHFCGRDVSKVKLKAIDKLLEYRIPITLVSTIEKGVNEDEIGQIIEFGLNTNGIRGINFQPVAFFGRIRSGPAAERTTLSGIIRQIESQLGHIFKPGDIIPLPCNVERVAITYLIKDSKGRFIILPRKIEVENYLPVIENTFAFDLDRFLDDQWQNIRKEMKVCDCFKLVKDLQRVIPRNYVLKSEDEKKRYIDEHTFRLSITSFVDKFNFDLRSMQKECVHVLTEDLRRIPFSAYNLVHRK